MKINPVAYYGQKNMTRFKGRKQENNIKKDEENPIKSSLEKLDVFKASLVAGLGFAARALYYSLDDGVVDTAFKIGEKAASKSKSTKVSAKVLLGIGSAAAIIAGVVGVLAAVYAIYNLPKTMYQGEINAHKKSEEMDVYLKGNRLEKDLYDQLGARAKTASEDEKEHLKEQYMKLRMAKNEVPAFAKFDLPNI